MGIATGCTDVDGISRAARCMCRALLAESVVFDGTSSANLKQKHFSHYDSLENLNCILDSEVVFIFCLIIP